MDTISAKVDGKKKKICVIRVNNDPENGLQFHLQSDLNFQVFAAPQEKTFKLGGVPCTYPLNGDGSNLNGVSGYFSVGSDKYQVDNMLNLSMLLAKDLKSGVTFNFGVMPIGEERIAEYLATFKNQVKMIFLSYMKPVSISMVISTETVEREAFD